MNYPEKKVIFKELVQKHIIAKLQNKSKVKNSKKIPLKKSRSHAKV